MKFYLAILAYAVMTLVLAWGILLMVAGKPFLLVAGFLIYMLLLIRTGCMTH